MYRFLFYSVHNITTKVTISYNNTGKTFMVWWNHLGEAGCYIFLNECYWSINTLIYLMGIDLFDGYPILYLLVRSPWHVNIGPQFTDCILQYPNQYAYDNMPHHLTSQRVSHVMVTLLLTYIIAPWVALAIEQNSDQMRWHRAGKKSQKYSRLYPFNFSS